MLTDRTSKASSLLNEKRVIAVIPARGGSKSVPGKNIRALGGKPLLAWSIEVAQKVTEIDRIIVSTDDDQIASVGLAYGAEVYARPPHLATDESLVIDALKDLIRTLQAEKEMAETLLLLEPTCPFRAVEDVHQCLWLLGTGEYDSVATFTDAELNPYRAWKIDDYTAEVFIPGAIPWLPRQQLPEAYQLNGAVYAVRIPGLTASRQSILFGRMGAVKMPRGRSVDIDNAFDFFVAEQLATQNIPCEKSS
jgi:CMP-N,N'-diacetyllegionaminic acid synthase